MNEAMLDSEKRLFTILAIRQRMPKEVPLTYPEYLDPNKQEPVWTGETALEFLDNDYDNELYPDTPAQAVAFSSQQSREFGQQMSVAAGQQMSPQMSFAATPSSRFQQAQSNQQGQPYQQGLPYSQQQQQ